jgi:hypothetical protein
MFKVLAGISFIWAGYYLFAGNYHAAAWAATSGIWILVADKLERTNG